MFISLVMVVKNEGTVLRRALESVQPPAKFWDEIVITDTGSTDDTMAIARAHGARVIEAPWPGGFGAARNLAAAGASPQADLVVNFDGDEVLGRGGDRLRQRLMEEHARGRRLIGLRYEWSHDATGAADLVFSRQVIYDPRLFRWVGRVHETLAGPINATTLGHIEDVTLEHWPKPQDHAAKGLRDLALLEADAAEPDATPRTLFYLGRQYHQLARHAEAIATLGRYLAVSRWPPERMTARHLIAASATAIGNAALATEHLMAALTEAPTRREPYVELARHHHQLRHWRECAIWGEAALAIPPDSVAGDYFKPADVYGWLPHDLLAVAYWHLGEKDRGRRHLNEALRLRPGDPRLLANRRWFES